LGPFDQNALALEILRRMVLSWNSQHPALALQMRRNAELSMPPATKESPVSEICKSCMLQDAGPSQCKAPLGAKDQFQTINSKADV
jgi:hypothetical protein